MKNFKKLELPTWGVIFSIYGAWLFLTLNAATLPIWALVACGALTGCWFMHMQHEILHGHPTRIKALNEAFAWLPVTLWMPYAIYRDSHIEHHRTSTLTEPGLDPESFYVRPETWDALPVPLRWVLSFNQTLLGRFLIGPMLAVLLFWRSELKRLLDADFRHVPAWTAHIALVFALAWWLEKVCGIPFWFYAATIAYPATALALLRSFVEHRPADHQAERTAIVQSNPFFGLLFLYNNLHVVHHNHPGMAWYEIPRHYRTHRTAILEENGGYYFRGYWGVAKRFFLHKRDEPVHPHLARPALHSNMSGMASGLQPDMAK